jgi:FkbH-like protein
MRVEEIVGSAQAAKTWLAYRRAAQALSEIQNGNALELPHRIRTAFLSSFTVEAVVDFTVVEAAAAGIRLETYVGGYGQFSQEILGASGLDDFEPEIAILMVEFEALVNRVAGRLPADAGRRAAESIVSLADAFTKRFKGTLVMSTFVEGEHWPLQIVMDDTTRAIREANQLVMAANVDNPRVHICDLDALASYFGRREALSPELLHMARMPFSEDFLALLARKIVSHLRAHRGMTRKCLVLDCDNTLWGGIVGEDGIEGIALGPDSPGREYVDFQRAVLDLQQQGVILAINSKNNLDDVLHVLRSHPHMLLREDHFASIQANWNDKPSNMRLIAEELNIGLDSFVFVDDNPTERAMMRAMLPEIHTLELPLTPSLYGRVLRETGEFAKASLTDEDRMRGQVYAAQRKREELKRSTVSVEDFLQSLEMVVSIGLARPSDIKRIAQLIQRTNQFNLTNRRYSEANVADLLRQNSARVYVLNVKDRFGDNGMVGAAIVVIDGDVWRIDALVMSCRVIGRRVEDLLVDRVVMDAAANGAPAVHAEYVRSSKNGLVSEFWQRMRFEPIELRSDYSAWRIETKAYESGEPGCVRLAQANDEAGA